VCLTVTILDPALAKRDQSHTNQAALIGMKFADEAIKSRATRRSNSTWSSSGSAGCPAGKVERRLVMIGVRLPEEGGPVGTIFPPASFGNLLPELAGFNSPRRLLRRVFRGDDRNYRAEHLLLHNFHLPKPFRSLRRKRSIMIIES
jgi:hypothetical protein